MRVIVLTTHEMNSRSRVSMNRNSALGGLFGGGATIQWQVDASDEAALVGSEEQGYRCKLICSSKSSHRDHLPEVLACTLVRFSRADMDYGRLRRSGTDHVRTDATAGQVRGPAFNEGRTQADRRDGAPVLALLDTSKLVSTNRAGKISKPPPTSRASHVQLANVETTERRGGGRVEPSA